MTALVISILIALVIVSAITALWLMQPHGCHERPRGMELDTYPATLAPLPEPERLRQPRACPDTPRALPALSVALSATRHPCYQYAARLAAQSWQSHHTLQRTYDMVAFATVVNALNRHEFSYA